MIDAKSLLQRVGLDLLELAADIAHQAHQFIMGGQRNNGEAGPNLSGVIVDRTDSPGFDQHAHQALD